MTNFEYLHQGLKHWQTAISSAVGFTGIIVSLFANSLINRRADNRRNKREIDNVRNAFSVELRATIEQAHDVLQGINEEDDNNVVLKIRLNTSVYTANQGRLTVLTPLEIASILRNYIFMDLVVSRLLLIGDRQNVFENAVDDWILVSGKTCKAILAENLKQICTNCSKALAQLEIHQTVDDALASNIFYLERENALRTDRTSSSTSSAQSPSGADSEPSKT